MKNGKAYNGEEHGKLYSPEFAAAHISTGEQQEKGKESEQGQGELYSPESAIKKRDSQNHQLKKGKEVRTGKDEEETERQSAAADDECMRSKPASKL